MSEIWKDIEGYEKLYQVSNLGNIKSLDRKVKIWSGLRTVRERILTPVNDKDKYLLVSLSKNNNRTTHRVAKLVINTFKPNPLNKPCINHKDGNKHNNSVSNLEYVTNQENTQHAFRTGLMKKILKPVLMSTKKGEPLLIFDSQTEASNQFNIHSSNITKCCSGVQKTAGGYCWQYA